MKEVRHRAFLVMVHSDTPAMRKLLEFVAVSAYVGCGRCWFEGCKYCDSKAGTYFQGYSEPAPQYVRGGGEKILASQAPVRTHGDHVTHGRAVEAGEEEPEQCGNKGLSPIARFLPYFDLVKGFPIPFGHAFLEGVVRSFWNEVLQKYPSEEERPDWVIPNKTRSVMEKRGEELKRRCTHTRGRPYRCIVRYRGSYTMEDLLNWTETDSLYVARGCLTSELAEAWEHLRQAALHYARMGEDPLDPVRRESADKHLKSYACIVEEVRTTSMSCFTWEICSSVGNDTFLFSFWGVVMRGSNCWLLSCPLPVTSNTKPQRYIWLLSFQQRAIYEARSLISLGVRTNRGSSSHNLHNLRDIPLAILFLDFVGGVPVVWNMSPFLHCFPSALVHDETTA